MSQIDEFFQRDCKIDAQAVDAYVTGRLNPEELATLLLETSWGDTAIDLTPAVKAAETVTELHLAPESSATKTALAYHREDGEVDCIEGDDLSRIISMTKLKDVDQSSTIGNGDVYSYNAVTNKFEPFDLDTALYNIDQAISQIRSAINNLQAQINTINGQIAAINSAINALDGRVTNIETRLTPPSGAPNQVAFGNINIYSDNTNTGSKGHGIFTHSTSTNVVDDEYFA